MRRISVFVCCLAGALAAVGQVQDVTVRATGLAKSYRAAVNEALVSALEQHEGVTINTSERQNITHDSSSVTERVNEVLDDHSKLEMNDAIRSDMQKWANGKILGYTVVSDTFEPGTGWRVVVDARFKGDYVVGLDPSNRRRLAVATFRIKTGERFSWNGQNGTAARWARTFEDRLNERLTQTRKFTVLDRTFDAEINAELKRLSDPNAAVADADRLRQKLLTDYLVVGEVSFSPVQPPQVNPLTGQTMPSPPQKFVDVSYRVLLAPTGQLKWSDTVSVLSTDFTETDITSFASASADGVAARVVDGLMANILPLEIVGKTASGLVTIGEGGKSVSVGETFSVFALGDVVTDSRTGEEIDEIEDEVGIVQIVRVTPKMSYAKVVSGDVTKMVPGSRLRRPPAPAAAPAPVVEPQPTTVRGNGTGGVIMPF